MNFFVEHFNGTQPAVNSENNLLNHNQIVSNISFEHAKHTNNIIVAVSFFCAVLALFTFGISLIGIPIAYIYKRKWDKKKQKAINGEYTIKHEICTEKTNNNTDDGPSSVKYEIFFNSGNSFIFRDDHHLYDSIKKNDACYVVYLHDCPHIAYAYKVNNWVLCDDVIHKFG